jgi:hypothetical protein
MRPETMLAVACAGCLGFFGLLFGTQLLGRWLRHKEVMAMIEQGVVPTDELEKPNGRGSLAWGIGIVAFGLAILCALASLWLLIPRRLPSVPEIGGFPNVTLLTGLLVFPGLIVLFIGVALIIVYVVNRPAPAGKPVEEALPTAALAETTLESEEDEGVPAGKDP